MTVEIRGVKCKVYDKTEGVVQIVPKVGPFTTVTGIYNPEILTARNEVLKALMKRASLEWAGIERYDV